MSTYTKTKTETPQPSEDRGLQRQNLISVFLIFLLLTLIVCSVLIFNKFSFTSKNIGAVEKDYEMQFIDLNDSSSIQQTQEQSIALTTQQSQTNQTTTTKPPVETAPKQQTTQSVTQTQVTQPTQSEKNVGLDGYMLTSANIQKYHSALMKEFEGHAINDYRVVWGDTLWKIAMKFNTTAHTLYVLNAMDNPDLIITGNVLKVSPNFIILRERTEKILLEAMGKTGMNMNNSTVGWFFPAGIVQDICSLGKENI